MKKIVLGLLLAMSALMAEDTTGLFVGLDMGQTSADTAATVAGDRDKDTEDGFAFTLKVGSYMQATSSRVTGFYHEVAVDDARLRAFGLSYDYLIGEGSFKPFLGATAGFGNYDVDALNRSLRGVILGFQAGVNYRVEGTPYSVELGYRTWRSDMEGTLNASGTDVDVELSRLTNFYIGCDYRF